MCHSHSSENPTHTFAGHLTFPPLGGTEEAFHLSPLILEKSITFTNVGATPPFPE